LAGGAAAQGLTDDDYIAFDPAQARLGQLLFHDKILSGNRNIACNTCHQHDRAGADGVSLGIGQGGVGLGPDRVAPDGPHRIRARVPRNAPALWNLGHKDIRVLFHDGRVQRTDYEKWDFETPAGDWLPAGLNSLLAAQALFPMASHAEMAGEHGENEVAGAVTNRIDRGWPILARRVRTIPEYGRRFVEAFPDVDRPGDVTIVHIANALAAFIGTEWRSHDSAWDDFVEMGTPLPPDAERGRQLFFGRARCASCHSGPLFTDQEFHSAGVPPFGPGRTRRFDPMPRDVGRMAVTDDVKDAYRFRTPSLRNVALTAPYGHNGAIPTLEAMIRHMADPVASRAAWRPEDAALPAVPWLDEADFVLQSDRREMARQAAAIDWRPVTLGDAEVADIAAFLRALTDEDPFERPLGRPDRVPSGLPVD
jgi:cytochrome c peroxidase